MNTYKALRDRQSKEMNAFPLGAAFSNKQFEEMMQKWGLTVDDTDKICSLGAGCFIRKSDKQAFLDMMKRFQDEKKAAIEQDKTGEGFIFDMFLYELGNHEYCITYDLDETLDAVGLSEEEINGDQRLSHGLQKAIKTYLKNCDEY